MSCGINMLTPEMEKPVSWIEKCKRIFLYGGLTKDRYKSILMPLNERNIHTLRTASLLLTIYCYLAVLGNALFFHAFDRLAVYFTIGTISLILLALSYIRTCKSMGTFFSYVFLFLALSVTVTLPYYFGSSNMPAVSFLVMIGALPILVIDAAWRMSLFVAGFSTLFLFLDRFQKTAEAYQYDLRNVAIFSLFGIIFYIFFSIAAMRGTCQKYRLMQMQEDVIVGLAEVVENRDKGTSDHIHRTTRLVTKIVFGMQKDPYFKHIMTKSFSANVIRAAVLHDIGKLWVPDQILNKPGKLTPEEYEIIKRHSKDGADLVERIVRKIEEPDYYEVVHNITLYHHERMDGKGYPEGLKGEQIPIEARIMAVADVYDALRSERIYKPVYSKEKSVAIIKAGRGSQFDARICDIFLDQIQEDDGYGEGAFRPQTEQETQTTNVQAGY